VVPVDGSRHSSKALELACDLAGKYGARLHILHVAEPRAEAQTMVLGAAAVTVEASPEELEDAGEKVIAAAKDIVAQHGCKSVDTEVTRGPPAQRILESARDLQADMIVMGSRGLSDIAGLLVGSVSHKVSHRAECTCVTVR